MENILYGAGPAVDGAGDKLASGCFALTAHPINAGAAEEKTAAAVLDLFCGGAPAAGKICRITDGKALTFNGISDKAYDCGGAVIIAPAGITLNGCRDLTFKNLTVVGTVTATDCVNITLENVDIGGEGDGLTASDSCKGLTVKSCRIVATGTALKSAANGTAVTESYLAGATGVETAGDDTTVQSCRIEASEAGIIGTGADYAARENTVAVSAADGIGIGLKPGGYCSLIAQNVIRGAQRSVKVAGGYNTVVILNSAVSVLAEDSISTFICDNALGGRVEARNNKYLLANGNTYPNDGRDHTALQENNENTNGDTVTDVDHRPEVGADESLLPHTNKDLFVGMERKTAVKDLYAAAGQDINAYIENQAKTSSIVIVAPGAYAHHGRLNMLAAQSNTTVYAYGVYQEEQSGLANVINIEEASNVTLKGIHVGYRMQSSGQVYILEKMGGGQMRVIGGAGMINEFGYTDPAYFNTKSMGAQHARDFYAWGDTHLQTIVKNDDGTMTMTVADWLYDKVNAGDVFTCRYVGGSGNRSIAAERSANVRYEDLVLYGNAASLAFYDGKNTTTTTYLRVHNTTRSSDIIDKETYDRYRALEAQYGVSLDVYVDDKGRYRGALPRIGSIDATHVGQCAVGSTIVSCIFENMCDDGTNQKGNHSRLGGLVDNGDGTATVTVRSNYPQINADRGNRYLNGCYPFSKGDRVFIYNAEGRLVCDSVALCDAVKVGTAVHPIIEVPYDIMEVKVSAGDVDFAAIEGYDLTDESPDSSKKVVIDNMSHASNNGRFDNILVRNVRSRGLLFQASGTRVSNCTFRNIGMPGIGAQHETIHWGESGVTEHMEIARCLFDNTGIFDVNRDHYAPITIIGMGKSVEEPYLLHRVFDIHHNKIVNRVAKYAVYINSARDVYLHDNDFGVTPEDSPGNPSAAVRIHGAMNIELKNNVYSPNLTDVTQAVVADLNKNVFGDDVSDGSGSLIKDDIA